MTTPTESRSRVRLRPAERREQLLVLGADLLATHSIDDMSIDLLARSAGISRGLLYHYFGNMAGFLEAVVEYAVADLLQQTEPPVDGEPLERLVAGLAAYVDYVIANEAGYRSIVVAAAGGNEAMRRIYGRTFATFADRMFRTDTEGEVVPDTPAMRLVVRGWQRFTEELVLAWCADPAGLSRDDLVALIAGALPALVAQAP